MDNITKKPTGKEYSSIVKFQAAMEVIKGKAVGEVVRLYGFHPTLFPRWKKQFGEKGPIIFEDRKTDKLNKKIEELTRIIGKKEIEIELFKKNLWECGLIISDKFRLLLKFKEKYGLNFCCKVLGV